MNTRLFLISIAPVLSLLMVTTNTNANTGLEYNFGAEQCGTCEWFVVIDGVMGGRSTAEIEETSNSIVLKGAISLENNGGFASIRTPFSTYDLSAYSKLVIRYRSSGQNFAVSLNNYRRFFQPKFKHSLAKTDNEWVTATLQLKDFYKTRMSTKLGQSPTEQELAKVIRLGLISDEKFASDFSLELDYIRFEQ